jgi:hypothetical protein
VQGAILSDHVKNQDWQARNPAYACSVPQSTLDDVANPAHVFESFKMAA